MRFALTDASSSRMLYQKSSYFICWREKKNRLLCRMDWTRPIIAELLGTAHNRDSATHRTSQDTLNYRLMIRDAEIVSL